MAYLFNIIIAIFKAIWLTLWVLIWIILIIFLILFLYKNYLKYKNILYKIFKFLIFIPIIVILVIIYIVLIYFLFLNLKNWITFDDKDKINLLFYVFQIFIISIWILVWYINYKELIRKNEWDHFPKVKINEKNVSTEITKEKTYFSRKNKFIDKDISLWIILENLWDNLINIDLEKVIIYWKDKNNKYIEKKLIYERYFILFHIRYIYLDIKNNLIFWKEIKNMNVLIDKLRIEEFFKKITIIEIYLILDSYRIGKTLKITLNNKLEYKDKERITPAYDFELKNYKFL